MCPTLICKVFVVVCSLLLIITKAVDVKAAQGMEHLKHCVVKIRNNSGEIGSGFIIATDKKRKIVYIVTAAHVVGEDEHPLVTFFSRPDRQVPASRVFIDRLQREGLDRGIAFLWVTENIPDDAEKLPLDLTPPPKGGEKVLIIGMPISRPEWSVIEGSIEGQQGIDIYYGFQSDATE